MLSDTPVAAPLEPPATPGPKRRFARRGLGLAWPSLCPACDRWASGARVCDDCRRAFVPAAQRCSGCALPLDDGAAARHRCSRPAPSCDACLSAVDYAFPWDRLVRRYKYAHEASLAAPLAALMIDAARGLDLGADARVVAVPPSRARLMHRGFDPAWELARRVGRALALPAAPDALVRRHDRAQAGAPLPDRQANMRSAIALATRARPFVRGRSVLLVDDVMTTGATLEAAAGRLREAGATRVMALVLARTPPPGPPPSVDAAPGTR